MSRAFVKEDVDPPTDSPRHRSPSGLPPGALIYLTTRGADYLRKEAEKLHEKGDEESAESVEDVLKTATIVDPPKPNPDCAVFGTKVTLRNEDGSTRFHSVVGVDELPIHPNAVSWISPIGRALLGAELGQRVTLDGGASTATIVAIEPL